MKGNRKAAEAMILKFMKDLDKSNYNHSSWEKILKDMSDKDFHEYMTRIRNGESTLVVFAPLFKSGSMTTQHILDVAKKHNVPMFERISISNDPMVPDYTTNQEFLLLDLPLRVQSQNLTKKISVPNDNRVIDQMTYQPTGDSKGSKLSAPELRVMQYMKLDSAIEEMMRFRGGDKGGFRALNAMGEQRGSVSLKTLTPYLTGVESAKAVKKYFLACMISFKD